MGCYSTVNLGLLALIGNGKACSFCQLGDTPLMQITQQQEVLQAALNQAPERCLQCRAFDGMRFDKAHV